MARVLVVSQDDPGRHVELWPDDETGDWDGRCNRCGWSVSGVSGRYTSIADAEQFAEVHVDQCSGDAAPHRKDQP